MKKDSRVIAVTFFLLGAIVASMSILALHKLRAPRQHIVGRHAVSDNATPAGESDLEAAKRLSAEARELQRAGNETLALTRLHAALERDPTNNEIRSEVEILEKSAEFLNQAGRVWIEALDEPAKEQAEPESVPASGPVLKILDAKLDEFADKWQSGLALTISIQPASDARLRASKVAIQAFFYDKLEKGRIALTDARVSYEWMTPHHNWSDTSAKVVRVWYARPRTPGYDSPSQNANISDTSYALTIIRSFKA